MKRSYLLAMTLVLLVGLLVVALVLTQSSDAPTAATDTTSVVDDATDLSAEDTVINALSGNVDLHTGDMFKTEDAEVCGIYDPNAPDESSQCTIETE